MVKGVQKKIIEVNHPDSLYFERAVFYLKPGVTQLPQQLSRADADALLREAAPDKAEKRFCNNCELDPVIYIFSNISVS